MTGALLLQRPLEPDELGIAVAKLVIALLVPDGEPVEVLTDDTLFRRRGRR